MADDLELTPEEKKELEVYLKNHPSAPIPDEKQNVHKFLHDVAESFDTTKTGYLKEEEIGTPINPVRTLKGIALICEDIIDNPLFANHFKNEAEILTSTSLSKDAKLLELAVTTTRQIADVTKKSRKENKSWFKKKGGSEE